MDKQINADAILSAESINTMFIELDWVMNFAKGNLIVCLACRTAITELINLVEATVPSSLLIKQNCRSQSFHAASWAVKFPTFACFYILQQLNRPLVPNLIFKYFLILDNQNQIAVNRQRLKFFQHKTNAFSKSLIV